MNYSSFQFLLILPWKSMNTTNKVDNIINFGWKVVGTVTSNDSFPRGGMVKMMKNGVEHGLCSRYRHFDNKEFLSNSEVLA